MKKRSRRLNAGSAPGDSNEREHGEWGDWSLKLTISLSADGSPNRSNRVRIGRHPETKRCDGQTRGFRRDEALRAAATAVSPIIPAVAVTLIEHAFSLLRHDDADWLETGRQAIDIFADAKRGHDAILVADRLSASSLDGEIAAHIQTQVARLLWNMRHVEKMRVRVASAHAFEGVSDRTRAELLALRALALSTTADRRVASSAGEFALEESRRIFARDAECDSLRALGESSRNHGGHDVAPSLDEVMSLQLLDRYDLSGAISGRRAPASVGRRAGSTVERLGALTKAEQSVARRDVPNKI